MTDVVLQFLINLHPSRSSHYPCILYLRTIDWRTKGVEPWAKQWFTENLVGTEANGVSIVEVTDVEGDCELGMRKSKLITVYDQKVRHVQNQLRKGEKVLILIFRSQNQVSMKWTGEFGDPR